ncbi:hypothetical protein [Pseudomonas sp. NPDC096950]|uniref:hypothetical protein n=1 Tax=Pseudomonas sp. NPDC096950 TaxID=3364485 RepID=UPI00383B130A
MINPSMKILLTALAAAYALTGCDAANDLATLMMSDYPLAKTAVITPGYKMKVGNQDVPVFGSDICPSPNDASAWVIAGPYPRNSTSRSCIVIAPETNSVRVQVVLPQGPETENWTVVRSADRIMLRRANGEIIAAAH